MSYERLQPPVATDDRLAVLQATYPEAFADGRIHWETLRDLLSDELEDPTVEHFGLSWPGKREARRFAKHRSRGALVPASGEGANEDATRNVFIEGENLEVLKLLQKAYAGRVKLIYIDPPYNTGNDFIYSDDFTEPIETYLRRTGQADEQGLLTTNPRASGRYHSRWLSMMYPRLILSRQLLRDDGVMFVSIDDGEAGNLRRLMDEVFGEENFLGVFVWKSRHNVDSRNRSGLSSDHEYVLAYGRAIGGKTIDETKYSNPDNDPRGPWMSDNMVGLATKDRRPNLHYDLIDPDTGINYGCPEKGWRYSEATMAAKIAEKRVIWPPNPGGRPRHKKFINELRSRFTNVSSILDIPNTLAGTRQLRELFGKDVFDFPKPIELSAFLLRQAADEDDIVLDFFAGTCPLADAALRVHAENGAGPRFVMVQIPEPIQSLSGGWELGYRTIADIGKDRIRRVITSITGQLVATNEPEVNGGDFGFRVFKLGRSCYRHWQDESLDDLPALFVKMEEAATPLLQDWQPRELLAEVMLWEGFPLDSTVSRQSQHASNDVRLVTSDFHDHRLWVCLDTHITDATVAQLSVGAEDVFICLDSALTDGSKQRLSNVCKLRTI